MMTSLQSSIEYVTKRVQTLEARAASDRHEIDRLQSVIVNITAGRKEVAFSARLSVTKEHMTDGTTVVFDQMISNYGDAYNPRTGIFTCTRTGLYLFSVSLEGHYTDGQGDIPAAITMDGTHLGYLVSDPIKSGQDVQGAVTMVTQVREGQRVWVEVYYRNDVSVFRTFSTFTGVLLS
ncbi:complement C1q tumor necrosis factor-related protein 2-like isoform X2 [Mya arenaria]|nr:complement C1q tumor necrosis factor-related protein 2-like isoform X2 [Mya arenaria]